VLVHHPLEQALSTVHHSPQHTFGLNGCRAGTIMPRPV
jgi:hypothetical protein